MIENLNMDFAVAVAIDTKPQPWLPSPSGQVWRKPLARAEAERGHATSVVRYEVGAAFPRHEHPLGEEILVLSGIFSDETGDYGPGMYFRNPPGSGHAPFSRQGCELLVKLHQFNPLDLTPVQIDTASAEWEVLSSGVERLHLHRFETEQVSMLRITGTEPTSIKTEWIGEELFVVDGELLLEGKVLGSGYWLRAPDLSRRDFMARPRTILWLKRGHLQSQ